MLHAVIPLILSTSLLIPFTCIAGPIIHPDFVGDDAFKKATATWFCKFREKNPSALSRPQWLEKSITLENFDFWDQNPYGQLPKKNSFDAKRAASPSAFYFRDFTS